MIWKQTALKLAQTPEKGLEAICQGRLSTYGAKSRYQLIIKQIMPSGRGALLAKIEERREALKREGVFDEKHKLPIPFLPERIAIITSPTGAVIRDIIHRIKDRFARPLLVYPIAVQGEKCGADCAKAIDFLNEAPQTLKPDLIIIARGGGSFEDLQGFHDEALIRSAFHSKIPIISAIGHESDHCLLDLVADKRAPTPSAAAEMAVPMKRDLSHKIQDLDIRLARFWSVFSSANAQKLFDTQERLGRAMELISLYQQRLDDMTRHLPSALKTHLAFYQEKMARYQSSFLSSPLIKRIDSHQIHIILWQKHMTSLIATMLDKQKSSLDNLSSLLEAVSYHNILARGFALIYDEKSQPISDPKQIFIGQNLTIEFARQKKIQVKRIDAKSNPSQPKPQKGFFDE